VPAVAAVLYIINAANAVLQLGSWPAWLLLIVLPIAGAVVASKLGGSWRTVVWTFALTTVLTMATALILSIGSGSSPVPRSPRPPDPSRRMPAPFVVHGLGRLAVRELVADGTDVVAVANAATLLVFDGRSLVRLGPARSVPGRIEHVVVCDGRVFVTYGSGLLAQVSPIGAQRVVRYGRPLADGQASGMLVCGAGALFVAMPLEAEIVEVSPISMIVTNRIRGVARTISGLAYANGFLYVEDRPVAGVIRVDLASDVATGWTVTAPEPAAILALGSGQALLLHRASGCVGVVSSTAAQEAGLNWSAQAPTQAAAVGGAHGVIVDTAGHVYRFDARTGARDSRGLRIEQAAGATSVAVTGAGRTVIAVPGTHQLVDIDSSAWKPYEGRTEPAASCVSASE
jgi:outer membrane protein assembly factor BamB